MFAVFKGANAQGHFTGPGAEEQLDQAHGSRVNALDTEAAAAGEGGSTSGGGGMGGSGGTGEPRKGSGLMDPTQADPQRVVLHGAAFGHWSAAPQVSWASILSPRSGHRVHVALCGRIENEGEIADLYNVDEEEHSPRSFSCTATSSSARLLVELYWKGFSDAYGDYSAQPETCLASLGGSWSFCLYDESSGYILVATSARPSPATTLHWATCPATGDVSVTTGGLRDLLDQSTASEFPPAGFFIKTLSNPAGELSSFLPKRMEVEEDGAEQGTLCSHMFRVASGGNITGLHAGSDVTAQ